MHACAREHSFQERRIARGRDFNRGTSRGAHRALVKGRERADQAIFVGEVFTAHGLPAISRARRSTARVHSRRTASTERPISSAA